MTDTEELDRLAASITPGPRVNESALHTLWTMGDCRMSFDAFKSRVLSALEPATSESAHPDDMAVDRFAAAMKGKLAKKRSEGRGGWHGDTCSEEILSRLLREHVEKGDPLDVGNLAMMLHQRGERITATSESAEPVAWAYEWKPKSINNAWQSDFSATNPLKAAVVVRDYRNVRPLYAHPQPLTVEAAAQVLLDKWLHGEFEDDADAIAQDQIDYGGDAADVIESWLRSLSAKGG